MPRNTWLLYVALAGLSWGSYVPLIFYGGSELGGKSASRLLAILCVGVAYFVLGVVFLVLLAVIASWQSGSGPNPVWLDILNRFIVPIAGWLGIAALAFLLVKRFRRRS